MSLIWLEILLGFGAPLAWGCWELYALRRDRAAARRQAAAAPADDATAPADNATEPTRR